MPFTGSCLICQNNWPLPDHRIADCGVTVAYLHEDQFFPGWTVLVLKRHATELDQVSASERSQMIEEVTAIAEVLAAIFRPVKLNYALLGNQLPHIHWHVVPRLANDPAPLEAIWGIKHDPKRLAAEDREARLAQIRQELGRTQRI